MLLRAHPWCRGVIKQQHRHCSSNYTPQLQDSSPARQPHRTKTIICTQPPIIARCWCWCWGWAAVTEYYLTIGSTCPPLSTLQHCSTAAQSLGTLPGNDVCADTWQYNNECQQLDQILSAPIYLYKLMYTTCYIL